jgi:hypothetical protein
MTPTAAPESETALAKPDKADTILHHVYLLALDFTTFACIERSLFYLSQVGPCWSHPNAVDPPRLLSTIPPLHPATYKTNTNSNQNDTPNRNNADTRHSHNNMERPQSRGFLVGPDELRGRVSFETTFATLFDRYRLVVAVDLSASVVAATLSSSPDEGLPFGQVRTALSELLRSVTMPVKVPGSMHEYCPTIHVTVIAKDPKSAMSVVVQAEYIDASNISAKVEHIVARLWKVERETNRERSPTAMRSRSRQHRGTGGVRASRKRHKRSLQNARSSKATKGVSQEHGSAAAVQAVEPGIDGHDSNRLTQLIELALTSALLRQLDECPVVVLITDGVSDLPDTCAYNNLLMKCRRSDVVCNIVQVGAPQQPPNTTFLHVADSSTLDFVARATGGVCVRASSITNSHISREAVASIVHDVVLWRSSRPAREDEFRVLMAEEPRVTVVKEVPRLMAEVERSYPWMDVAPAPVPLVVNRVSDCPVYLLFLFFLVLFENFHPSSQWFWENRSTNNKSCVYWLTYMHSTCAVHGIPSGDPCL